ncbi:hypothetical protein TVAG_211470 [Trichomonas vaginalis G3]|uniref:CS domain-containing protein n=1 Tax=Trichomonas vaginalis (strain ATCC PRA-98 / G3) TaxID=412133 RepID=A2EKY7_TRIV3|nr:HCP-like family [Trichomonas vaginalis G3]EAY06695.1 hypothetical protein TVAG_211470 [Trichomonas vaginalis G3]KAI5491704.1 HCP-like family [Trichomonas vaginalis G3]|eukprot:XP_001318918.1 hypothetical protein [Trichomonas vaginalis G3]
MIKPELMRLYIWDYSQKGNIINIGIMACPGADLSKIKTEIDQDSILVSLPNEPPIIAGKLFMPVKTSKTKLTDKGLIIALITDSEKEWPTIVVAPHPKTQQLDPLTAFSIFQVNMNSNNPDLIQGALPLLFLSSDVGYPPALIAFYDIFHTSLGMSQKANGYLNLAMEKYNYPIAFFKKGMELLQESNDAEKAIEYFTKSEEFGYIFAKTQIGAILSPLSKYTYSKKDATKAAQLFESVLKEDEDITALHELSKLLYTGTGVPQDKARAKSMMAKVKSAIPDVPDLEILDKPVTTAENHKSAEESPSTDNKEKKSPNDALPARVTVLNKKVENLNKKVDDLATKIDMILNLLQNK